MRHDINAIRNEFNEICEILTPTDFKKFLNECDDYGEYREWRERYSMVSLHTPDVRKVEVSSGCTRVVISLPNSDYVFKIQFDTSDRVDYCRNECFVYSKAVEHECEEFFAWIACIGTYGQAVVYAMEKVEVNEDRNSDDSYTYHANRWHEEHEDEDEDDMCIDDYDDHDGMIEYAIAHNGPRMEIAEQLIYDLGVNDLHSANWGYRGDVLVAVDYGGYGEDAVYIAKMERGEKI